MTKFIFIFIILLPAISYSQSHKYYLSNVTNFAREITGDAGEIEPNWTGVLNRQPVKSSSERPTFQALSSANASCNRHKYELAQWQTPQEFNKSSKGDCKSYAICKYYKLRASGFKPEQLNIWSGSYNGASHMVLVAALDGKEYVLDIGAESNLPLAQDYFYKKFIPAYRFNEKGFDVDK